MYQGREPSLKTPSQEKSTTILQTTETELAEQYPPEETPTAITKPTVEEKVESPEKKEELTEKEKSPEILQEQKEVNKKSGDRLIETQIESETLTKQEKSEDHVKKTQKTRKPYKRKLPTEEVKERPKDSQEGEKKEKSTSPRKEIDLGETQRQSQRIAKFTRKSLKKRYERKEKENVLLRRVASPFVELDLIEARILLVLPEQEFNLEDYADIPQEVNYTVSLNPEEQKISAMIVKREDKVTLAEEKRIELKDPLKSFSISFPGELEGRTYNYKHGDDKIYAFVATGNNRARMYYLYDKEGKFNPLPKRDVWILLKEDFSLDCEPDIIEEIWVWDKYQPSRFNLLGINEIRIQNGHTNKEEKMPCEASFWIEGGGLVEDDFSSQTPIFSEGNIKINSIRQNPSGWIIWVQNKYAGHLIAAENWNGAETLELEIPNHLPCDCGEFQIDICEKSGGLPVDTLFFRYVPGLQLEYDKDLLFPDPRQGHDQKGVRVFLKNIGKDFHLSACNEIQTEGDWHHVEMPPDEDVFSCFITRKAEQETVTPLQVTLPRLKWRIAEDQDWADQPLKMKKNDLVSGTDRYLSINTNDLRTKYDILATLKQSRVKLHEERFIRKGAVYILWLNKFYETIITNKGDVALVTEVCEKGGRSLGTVESISFCEESSEKLDDASEKTPERMLKSLVKQIHKKRIKKPKAVKPNVKGRRGMRAGKGFSRKEIIKAGIRKNGLRRLHITLDKRRKTIYLDNVKNLMKLVGVKKNGD